MAITILDASSVIFNLSNPPSCPATGCSAIIFLSHHMDPMIDQNTNLLSPSAKTMRKKRLFALFYSSNHEKKTGKNRVNNLVLLTSFPYGH